LQTAQIMGEINKFWEGPIAKCMDPKLGFWPMPAEIGLSKNWVPAKSKALGQDPLTLSPGAVCFFRKVHKWLLNRFQSLGFRVLGFRVGNVNIDVRWFFAYCPDFTLIAKYCQSGP
jgi:hypothetical protein